MDEALSRLVRRRANGACEYCRLRQDSSSLAFEIDHIIARKHGGKDVASNLALACFYCNSFKGSDIAGIDPRTRRLTRLFHPRRHKWTRHFAWDGPILVGRTAIGRTTIAVLRINDPVAVEHRQSLLEETDEPTGTVVFTPPSVPGKIPSTTEARHAHHPAIRRREGPLPPARRAEGRYRRRRLQPRVVPRAGPRRADDRRTQLHRGQGKPLSVDGRGPEAR
jgi:hypothetical protein